MTLQTLPKYETYKDSNIEWLGEIPDSWKVSRLKYLFLEINERSQNGNEELLSVSQYTGVTKKSDKVNDGDLITNAETLEGYKKVKKGDLVSNIMLAWNGSLAFSSFDGITSPAYSVYRLKEGFISSYFHYLLRTDLYKAEYKRKSSGVIESRLRLYTDDFYDVWGLIPSLEEQTAIAHFLDQKTAQIDAAIAIKEQQIALLKERKQILIQQAVTQGLDPTVPMKNSGVEWIGEIPAHWVTSKIGHFAKVYNGSTPSRDVSKYWLNGTIPWLASGKVNDFIVRTSSELVSVSALKECSLRIFPQGTVIIGIVGQGKTRGTSARLEIDATINQNVAGIIPQQKLRTRFLHYYLIQAYEQIRNYGQGSNQEALNCQLVSSIKIVVPSVIEQDKIVSFIESQIAKSDETITLQQQQIEKLREYKTTLINSAVTGKIRVTNNAVDVSI